VEFIGSVIVLVGVVALGTGAWGLARGQVGWARVVNRKVAGGVLVGSLGLMSVGGAVMPGDDKVNVAATAGESGTVSLPGDPTTTSSAPGPLSTTATSPTGAGTGTTATTGQASTATTAASTTSTTKAVTTTRPSTTSSTQKTTSSTGGSDNTTSSSGPSTSTSTNTSTTGPAGTCTASVSNPNPTSPGGSVTVNVASSLPNRGIEVRVEYKTTKSEYSGTTNGAGAGSVTFQIGQATKGYTVEVEVRVGGDAKCFTQFTPV
jgi:hypothetical protein